MKISSIPIRFVSHAARVWWNHPVPTSKVCVHGSYMFAVKTAALQVQCSNNPVDIFIARR